MQSGRPLLESITALATLNPCEKHCSLSRNGYKLSYQQRRAPMPETFETFIASERERLANERTTLLAQQTELAAKLAAITREFEAIDAYEAAKKGKAAPARASGNRRA